MNILNCRVCLSSDLEDCINLGDQPWCNDFITEDLLGAEKKYPLVCAYCHSCSTLQVKYTVPKEIMYSDHTYLSGSTKTMLAHFDLVSDYVCNKLIDKKGLVVDIGSNDGTLLSTYKKRGMDVYGVEACEQTARIANKNGIFTKPAFFNDDCANEIINKKGKAMAISAANVFYHVEDLHSIVSGISRLLDEDGVFVVQASYLPNLIKNKAFDIMYHEHLLYYRVENLNTLLKQYGLEIFDVHEAPVHGGSIVAYVCHKGKRTIRTKVDEMIQQERVDGYNNIDIYKNFDKDIQKLRESLLHLLGELKSSGHSIYAYGAPAKGTVLLNYCGIDNKFIDKAVEVNKLKFGRYIPCTSIQIVDESLVDDPDYYLLLSWNFASEILMQEKFKSGKTKIILPLPHPKVLEA